MEIDLGKVLDTLTVWVTQYSVKLVAAILIFIIGRWISRRISKLLGRLLDKNNVDVTVVRFAENLIYYALIVVVLIAAVGQLGINTISFLTIVGAAGLAIGLALKDSLSNFAAGVILILFRPFRVGDFVEAGGVTGTVQGITMFNTILNSPDNQKVIVPNGIITSNVITNVTANDTRRIDLVIGISYSDDIAKAKEIVSDLLQKEKRVLSDPAPVIAVSELADSSVNLVVRPWVKTGDYWTVRFDLTEEIKNSFDEAGISIPYPQQDVHLFNEQTRDT
ncbi:MAG: mechanosensitive ion channel [Thermodesulfobacteriota bacterium]|nr:mechanosensitive ion channel [Thermodesulfobacteriota bacterium]